MQHLFTPFVTTKAADVGTGLGLVICRQIVTELGGEIKVESQIGVGTTFRVFLNRSRVPEGTGIAEPVRQVPVHRGLILLIDDDPTICTTLGRMLSTQHDVTIFNNASEALQLIQSGKRFDVILCDMMMPVITGPEFYDELRKVVPAQADRVVFLTGGVFTAAARDFLDRVSNRQLDKPITMKRLLDEVNRLIRSGT